MPQLRDWLDFPQRCAGILADLAPRKQRALDLGCAVGGAVFALADTHGFEEVVGVDYSRTFVDAATRLAEGEAIPYERPGTAGATVPSVARRPPAAHATTSSSVRFVVGDACDEAALLDDTVVKGRTAFDAVLCANLLCRLARPDSLLDALPKLVRDGGVVLFASPYSWFDDYTPDRAQWCRGPEDLIARMADRGFVVADTAAFPRDLPLLIRDHARKYQLIFSNAIAFRKYEGGGET